MRVLWFGHNLAYPPKTGPLQRNYNLLREAAKSCEVHVVAFDQPSTRTANISPQECVEALSKFCASVQWVQLPSEDFPGNRHVLAVRSLCSNQPLGMMWLRSSDMKEKLHQVTSRISFDVVHFDTLGLAQYLPYVGNAGTVLNHHDVESVRTARRVAKEQSVILRKFLQWEATKLREAEKKWCPRFGLNLAVSDEEAGELVTTVPGLKTCVVPNGVDTDYFTPRVDPGGQTLLFCGSLDWYANAEAMKFFFDTIWPIVTKRLHKVQIYVIGRKPPLWLKQIAEKDSRVHVTGFVEDVRPYFEKSTVYVCPIRDGGGTRLKILDTLAMGVPLVATPFACSGLSLEDRRDAVFAEDPEDFASSIDRLLSDQTLRIRLAKAGRKVAEGIYSWKVIGANLRGAYEVAKATQTKLPQ